LFFVLSFASASTTLLTAFAVCGKLKGYGITSEVLNPLAFGETISGNSCPAHTVPLSGGAFTRSTGLGVTLGATFLNLGGWTDYLVNTAPDGAGAVEQAFVVCAGT